MGTGTYDIGTVRTDPYYPLLSKSIGKLSLSQNILSQKHHLQATYAYIQTDPPLQPA
jgi:hypothetical protein